MRDLEVRRGVCGVWCKVWIVAAWAVVGASCEARKRSTPEVRTAPAPGVSAASAVPGKAVATAAVAPAVAMVPPAIPEPELKANVEAERAERDEVEARAAAKARPAAAGATELPPLDKLTANNTLSEKMQRRIRFRLRDRAKAPIALRNIIHLPNNDDGSNEVFAIYEYSAYEDCVRGYPTRKEGRSNCLERKACVGLGAVRAVFAPPRAGTPAETGGAISLWSMELNNDLCSVESESIFVADVDGDDKLEMVIDVTTVLSEGGDRGQYVHSFARAFYVFPGEEDVEGTVGLPLGRWDDGETACNGVVEFRDINHDGRRDLIHLIETDRCDETGKARFDRDDGEPDPCAWENRDKTIYLYDAKLDRWINPEDSPSEDTPPAAPPATPLLR